MASNATNYHDVSTRRQTFKDWRLGDPDALSMAQAGFIHTGTGDMVECYGCGVRIDQWTYGQDPWVRHTERVDYCPLVEEHNLQRDPEGPEGDGEAYGGASYSVGDTQPSAYGGSHELRFDPIARMVADSGRSTIKVAMDADLSRARLSRRRPRSPVPQVYRLLENRLTTFTTANWNPSLAATPEKLAKAGFYYLGSGDRVQCAYCQGKLRSWRPDDIPIEAHLAHFPMCTYIKNIEEQTAVLARNIRTKRKNDDCVSSAELIRQYQEERKQNKIVSPAEQARVILKKMRYSTTEIQQAQHRLIQKNLPLSLETYLEEVQHVTRDRFFRDEPPPSDDELELESGDEEAEETKPMVIESVEEITERLQRELRVVEREREELTRQTTCKVCLERPVDTLYLTCRHLASCRDCADQLKDCPLCRKVILGTIDVYLT